MTSVPYSSVLLPSTLPSGGAVTPSASAPEHGMSTCIASQKRKKINTSCCALRARTCTKDRPNMSATNETNGRKEVVTVTPKVELRDTDSGKEQKESTNSCRSDEKQQKNMNHSQFPSSVADRLAKRCSSHKDSNASAVIGHPLTADNSMNAQGMYICLSLFIRVSAGHENVKNLND